MHIQKKKKKKCSERETSIGCNPVMCPDRELNQRPLALRDDAHPTGQHLPGLTVERFEGQKSFPVPPEVAAEPLSVVFTLASPLVSLRKCWWRWPWLWPWLWPWPRAADGSSRDRRASPVSLCCVAPCDGTDTSNMDTAPSSPCDTHLPRNCEGAALPHAGVGGRPERACGSQRRRADALVLFVPVAWIGGNATCWVLVCLVAAKKASGERKTPVCWRCY